jgi:MATE family multidrug resistance protein
MRLRLLRQIQLWNREIRPTLALALPIMAGMVSQMLMGLADTIMVGRVGVIPLAACTLVNAIAHLPLVFGIGLLSSIAVLTSQAFGARKRDEAGEVLRHGMLLSLGTGLLAALSLIALLPFLGRLGQPVEVVDAAGTYLVLLAISLLPALVAHGGKQFSEALKHPWAPTFILLSGVFLNVFLNWVLIYGNLGAPAMGLEGAGWATIGTRVLIVIAMLAYVFRGRDLRAFHPVRWRARLEMQWFKDLFHLGTPVAVQHLFEVGAFAFAALMMGWISAEAIAAHQIALACASTTFMFGLGIGVAACIRVGHAYGAAQYLRMRRIGFGGVGLAVMIMGMFGLVFILGGKWIAGWFIDSPAVVALGAQLLFVAAVFQVADGIQIASISALRGLSDVRVPAVIALLAYWAIALPLGSFLAFVMGMGAIGIWIGLAGGLGVAAVGLLLRFHLRTRRAPERTPPLQPAIDPA